MFKQMHP